MAVHRQQALRLGRQPRRPRPRLPARRRALQHVPHTRQISSLRDLVKPLDRLRKPDIVVSVADLTFLGAARTVTGSKYLLEHGGKRVLVDCGLFQGLKELRLRNWAEFPIPPREIDAVVLTHAHLDHVGYLPRLRADGYKGRVFCTAGTMDLCRLVLPDSGRIQEEDARQANRHGYSKHQPALPLYTESDALACADAASADRLSTARSRSSPASRSSSYRQDICWARRLLWRGCSLVRQFCSAATSDVTRVPCCPIRQTRCRPMSCWWSPPTAIAITSRTTTASSWRRWSAARSSAAAS